jgi:hypothetical protein
MGARRVIHRHEVQAVSEAIRDASRCPSYDTATGDEGLDGCEDCLERCAKAALRAMEQAEWRRRG